MSRDPVVLGVGNVLAGDDAVGPRVVGTLAEGRASGRLPVPTGARLVDGGTAGIGLLPVVAGADRLVVVDAALPAGSPGRVTIASEREAIAAAGGGELGLLLGAAALAGLLPRELTLVTVEARSLDPGAGLSASAAAGIDVAAQAVVGILAETGSAVR